MSGIVAFFGHRDVVITSELENKLEEVVRDLVASGYNEFWCCEQGNFDWLSRIVMQRVKEYYKYLHLCYIYPYNPSKYSKARQKWIEDRYEVIYPNEAAEGPQHFAIERRNKYIVENADVIVCYIAHKSKGAYKAVKLAEKQGKKIINLYYRT